MITSLKENEIFVFGSNLSGFHGAGAAKTAMEWGAIWGQGVGLQGKTYAIPTKSEGITRTLTIEEIKPYVDEFIQFAIDNPNLEFLVTEIGCGLAGLTHIEVAPLFISAVSVPNIHLPEPFEIIEIVRCNEIIDNWGNMDVYKGDELISLLQTPDEWTDDMVFITPWHGNYCIDDLINRIVRVNDKFIKVTE